MAQKLRTLSRDKGYSSDKPKKPFEERKTPIVITGVPQKNYTKALLAAEKAVEPFRHSL